ncbi:hypothetical protein [Aliiroseovarius crassostreae]|uniref:hypothetical protein n=1 Tax=Aliiroseovarius crassostreae TaxID=154981 RepID=UPI003C7C8641
MTRLSLRSFTRGMMMPFLVAALSLNPMTSGPALAGSKDNEDVGALIAALLGLAVVGTIIAKSNDRDDDRAKPKPRRHVKPAPKRHSKYRLPNKCLRKFQTQFGKKRYWGRGCLNKRYDHVKSLPKACRDTVVIKNNDGVWVPRKVFHPRCLKEAGYRKRH